MSIIMDRKLAILITITGVLLVFSTLATLAAVIKVGNEVEENRQYDCIGRSINGLKTPAGCERYLNAE